MAEKNDIKRFVSFDKGSESSRKEAIERMGKVQFTPLEGQVAFLKELIKFPEEANKFSSNPKQYAVDHGVLLDPAVIQKLMNQVLFDISLDEDFVEVVGPHVAKDIVDLRNRVSFPVIPVGDPTLPDSVGPVAAIPAAVAAAAAVVAVAVAVVTMVVTLTRHSRPADLVSLQGLGTHGTLLPGGQSFVDRSGISGANVIAGLTRGGFIR